MRLSFSQPNSAHKCLHVYFSKLTNRSYVGRANWVQIRMCQSSWICVAYNELKQAKLRFLEHRSAEFTQKLQREFNTPGPSFFMHTCKTGPQHTRNVFVGFIFQVPSVIARVLASYATGSGVLLSSRSFRSRQLARAIRLGWSTASWRSSKVCANWLYKASERGMG